MTPDEAARYNQYWDDVASRPDVEQTSLDETARYNQYWDEVAKRPYTEQMPLEDSARWNQHWRNLNYAAERQSILAAEAEAAQQRAIAAQNGGRLPTMSSAVVNRINGRVYLGTSGRPYPSEIHPELAARMPNPSLTRWNVPNCAEFQACNLALLDGAQMEDLVVNTVRTRTGLPEPRCSNCQITTSGAIVPSDRIR